MRVAIFPDFRSFFGRLNRKRGSIPVRGSYPLGCEQLRFFFEFESVELFIGRLFGK